MKIIVCACFAICIALMIGIIVIHRQRKHPIVIHDMTEGEESLEIEIIDVRGNNE